MDKEILNKLKLNLQKLEQSKDKKRAKKISPIDKNTQIVYYEI